MIREHTAPSGCPQLQYALRTDPGRKREVNEDSGLAVQPCFIVADGMGGHEAGDLASQAAVAAFRDRFPLGSRATVEDVSAALDAARAAVAAISEGHERGAGCTLTGAVLVESDGHPHWLVLNIGDSRVYLHRGSELTQLTIDHSLRAEMSADGAEDARLPGRNIITRALGSADSTADSWLVPVETGTRLLICSDGLTTEVPDEDLRAALTMGGAADAVADELVQRANDAGGRDNITVLVVDTIAGGSQWVKSDVEVGETGDETLTVTIPRRRHE
ncbi:serine/threonine-protein phosphatase [Leucobacter sp. CSA2]|uniref:Serine/threonine-protein phosphatase n=1 Tax=Leucobacter edaphi TaxID=2796472 RepID=A0A934QBN8_9MICO|nr:protein phosphatase 2C domain-containing protein [Leucobacter edaphi]MBK0421661.1 serine/threonine-protein phosphatase [Leucobacter edaphi]